MLAIFLSLYILTLPLCIPSFYLAWKILTNMADVVNRSIAVMLIIIGKKDYHYCHFLSKPKNTSLKGKGYGDIVIW